jgi:hypothetical protein
MTMWVNPNDPKNGSCRQALDAKLKWRSSTKWEDYMFKQFLDLTNGDYFEDAKVQVITQFLTSEWAKMNNVGKRIHCIDIMIVHMQKGTKKWIGHIERRLSCTFTKWCHNNCTFNAPPPERTATILTVGLQI